MDIKTIRTAMEKRHGGADKWTDQQIMEMWHRLPPDVQTEYLKEPKSKVERKKPNADSDRPESDV